MNITKEKTVASVVTENIKAAHIFKKHGIDFCCGGGITIDEACKESGIDYTVVKNELKAVDNVSKSFNYDAWELDFLIDHILNIHHTYVEENVTLLLQYADKVAMVHGDHHAELITINELFKEVADELTTHMKKEELILFPYVKQLVKAKRDGVDPKFPEFVTVNNPIKMMENEHEFAGEIFKTIARLSNQYTTPNDSCNTFKAFFAKLEEFELDLHQHIHLENNILFPKAIALEQEFE
ncbi:MAG: iron-sulfur cluster repair di-iron protein [Flavobacteriaceae bacterium]|nr:MAG: iron-sulfur cluster repair di-iron protein [Flavobacteriaceae bacterium]